MFTASDLARAVQADAYERQRSRRNAALPRATIALAAVAVAVTLLALVAGG